LFAVVVVRNSTVDVGKIIAIKLCSNRKEMFLHNAMHAVEIISCGDVLVFLKFLHPCTFENEKIAIFLHLLYSNSSIYRFAVLISFQHSKLSNERAFEGYSL
ncbi:hypothetical protein T4B_1708, partial [Trichinella pseudospiralis]